MTRIFSVYCSVMTTLVFVRIVVVMVIALIAVNVGMLMCVMRRPGRKRVGDFLPASWALGHFRIGEEACVESGLNHAVRYSQRHDGEFLPPVAEGFLPLSSSSLRHFRFSDLMIAGRPPVTS